MTELLLSTDRARLQGRRRRRRASSPATCCGSRSRRRRDGLKTCVAHLLGVGPSDGAVAGARCCTSTARSSTSARRSRSRSAPRGNERIVFEGAISALEADFDEGADARGRRLRRGRADAAAHDAAVEDLRADVATPTSPRRSPAEHGLTPDADADGPDLRRRPAVEPERPRVPARARADGSRPSSGATATRSASRRAATARRPTLTLVAGQPAARGSSARADLAHQRTKVDRQRLRRRRSARRSTRRPAPTPSRPRSAAAGPGPAVLEQAFGERVSLPRPRGAAASTARRRPGRRPRCCAARARSSPVVGVTRGTPDMVVGSKLDARARRRARSTATATTSRASGTPTTSRDGHRTHFEAERADARARARHDAHGRRRRRAATSASTRRIVTDIVDPDEPRPRRGAVPVARHQGADDVRAWATLLTPVRRRRPGHRDPARASDTAGRRRVRGRRPAPPVRRRRVLERRRDAAGGAGGAEQQAAAQDARREHARVRRHRRRREGHARR